MAEIDVKVELEVPQHQGLSAILIVHYYICAHTLVLLKVPIMLSSFWWTLTKMEC